MQLAGTKTLVVGMKKSGQAAVELLVAQRAEVRATDLKPLDDLPGARELLTRLNVPYIQQTRTVFDGCELIVLSPDVPFDLEPLNEARRRGVPVIGEVELAAPFLLGENIGITGSNGKTTTTSLVGHILRESGVPSQIGGNIGSAVCGMVATSHVGAWNVLELSSFQLETIYQFRAAIGVTLNVTQNHLDRHHEFEYYVAAKRRLLETQHPLDLAILNADDPVSAGFASAAHGQVQWFSGTREVSPGAFLRDGQLWLEDAVLMNASEIPIRGQHNVENVLAAALVARRVGVSAEAIAAAVRTFHAVEHRLEFVRTVSGIDIYNDSKATSVDATLKALSAFTGGLWVILGGKDKGLDYSVLREPLKQKARAVLLIGAAAAKIRAQLNGAVPLIDAGTMDVAVAEAYKQAVAGDTVLLAPACASFDQFRSFEHRGETFKALANALEAKN